MSPFEVALWILLAVGLLAVGLGFAIKDFRTEQRQVDEHFGVERLPQ